MDTMQRIVFYDGVCKFCNRSVNTLIKLDQRGRIMYSPLQGELAKAKLPEADRSNLDSLVYLRKGTIHHRSSAVLFSLADAAVWLCWLHVFRLIPAVVRDACYAYVAKNRYRWFGKHDSCMIPSGSIRQRFIP